MTRRTPTIKPSGVHAGVPGCWAAWVEDGGSRDERRRRLAAVPERFRGEVERQVRVAFAASNGGVDGEGKCPSLRSVRGVAVGYFALGNDHRLRLFPADNGLTGVGYGYFAL